MKRHEEGTELEREVAATSKEIEAALSAQRQIAYRRAFLGGTYAFVGIAAGLTTTSLALAPLGVGLGGLLAFIGIRGLGAATGIAFRAGAMNEVERGRFDAALALLDVGDARSGRGRRTSHALRAQIALVRGDLAKARAELDTALARPVSRVALADLETAEVLQATALRALVAALEGDDATAARDADAVRDAVTNERFGRGVVVNEVWVRAMLARVALAEALVLSRTKGAGSDLAAHLETHAHVLSEGTTARERALYRGLVRLSRARKKSAYREPPKAEQPLVSPSPEAWVERLAPDVGAFLDRDRPRLTLPRAASTKRAPSAVVAPVRPPRPRLDASKRMLLLWVAIAAAFFAVWQILDARPRPTASRRAPVAPPTGITPVDMLPVIVLAVVAFFAGLVGLRLRAAFARARAGNRMMRQLALGEPIDAPSAGAAALGAFDLVAMMRHTALSRAAFAEARFDAALASADAAFVEVAKLRSRMIGEFQGMLSEARARALAGLGRGAEARGEVASWPRDYSRRVGGAVAVELLAALREGDEEQAQRIAARVNDELSLDVRTEALLDLLRARRGAIGLVDRARLREDVRAPELRRFLRAVAPDLLADFEGESHADVSEEATASSREDATDAPDALRMEAETEAAAEAEAASEAEAVSEAEAAGTNARRRSST